MILTPVPVTSKEDMIVRLTEFTEVLGGGTHLGWNVHNIEFDDFSLPGCTESEHPITPERTCTFTQAHTPLDITAGVFRSVYTYHS